MISGAKKFTVLTIALLCALTSFSQKEDSTDYYARYYFIAFQEYEYVDTDLAKKYADSGLYFASKTGDPYMIGKAHQFKGWYFQDIARFDKAIEEFSKSLASFKKAKNSQGQADAYGNLGNAYYDNEDFQKSLDYQLLSLDMNRKILEDTSSLTEEEYQNAYIGRTYALHNIGSIYAEIGMYKKALEYEYKSIQYELESENWQGVAISYNTIGKTHRDLGNTDSAVYYYQKAFDLLASDKVNDQYTYANTLQSYAALENSGLSEEERNQMWLESLKLKHNFGDIEGEVQTYLDIVEFRIDVIDPDSTSKLLEHAYNLIEEYSLDGQLERYFKLYSIYNSKIGQYDSAYFALENYLELKAISDEKSHAQELIAGDIKHQLETDFALKEARHDKEIAEFQNIVYLSIICFIILITILAIFVSSSRRRKRINKLLSEKNKLIQVQKEIVEEKNKSISDSIVYARRLQQAILPTTEQVNEYLPNSFLFFRPKDIVSGDFYWFESNEDHLFIAVADCTGHGVPGAMVSVVCSNALNRCVKEHKLNSPKDILNKARDIVIETFAKSGDNVADGMDISLVVLDRKSKKVRFAGAHNSLWIVRKGEAQDDLSDNSQVADGNTLLEYKGDKQPVGLHSRMVDFTEKEIDLLEDDTLYLMSDGFADQFGGPDNKKLKYAPIKEYLLEHAHHNMKQQKEGLTYLFDNWRSNNEQIDDVCFIGFRLN